MVKVETIDKEMIKQINRKFNNKGIRSDAEIDYIAYKVGATRGLNQKAATLLMETIRRHAFVDGNKRTAFEAMDVFLKANGKELKVEDTSKMNVVFWVTRPKTTVEEIAMWIANHTRD